MHRQEIAHIRMRELAGYLLPIFWVDANARAAGKSWCY